MQQTVQCSAIDVFFREYTCYGLLWNISSLTTMISKTTSFFISPLLDSREYDWKPFVHLIEVAVSIRYLFGGIPLSVLQEPRSAADSRNPDKLKQAFLASLLRLIVYILLDKQNTNKTQTQSDMPFSKSKIYARRNTAPVNDSSFHPLLVFARKRWKQIWHFELNEKKKPVRIQWAWKMDESRFRWKDMFWTNP